MSAFPFMPFYVTDYLADAAHLSTIEHGAYLLLIMNYWQRGEPLPCEDKRLARIARMTDAEWADAKPQLCEFFSEKDGALVHNRIERELNAVREKSAKAASAGKVSADKRANVRSTPVEQTLNYTDLDTDTDSSSLCSELIGLSPSCRPSPTKSEVSEDFDRFWQGYSPDPSMSRSKALTEFTRLSVDDRQAAIAALPHFLAHCRGSPTDRPLHPWKFLRERRFDGFLHKVNAQTAVIQQVFVKQDTPQWQAWEAYKLKTTGKKPPVSNGGWHFPTEFPPGAMH